MQIGGIFSRHNAVKKSAAHYHPPCTARTRIVALLLFYHAMQDFLVSGSSSQFAVGQVRRQVANRSRADNKKRNLSRDY
jgi:hypothetical protein